MFDVTAISESPGHTVCSTLCLVLYTRVRFLPRPAGDSGDVFLVACLQ